MDEDCVLNAEILMQSTVPVDFTTNQAFEESSEQYFCDDLTYIMESDFINEPDINSCTDDDSETDDSPDTSEDSDAIHAQSMKNEDSDAIHGQLIKKEDSNHGDVGIQNSQNNMNYKATIVLYSSSDSEEGHVNENKTTLPSVLQGKAQIFSNTIPIVTNDVLPEKLLLGDDKEDIIMPIAKVKPHKINSSETVVKNIVDEDATNILPMCQVGHEDSWSSSDNCLSDERSATSALVLKGKAKVFNNIKPLIMNEPGEVKKIVEKLVEDTTKILQEQEGLLLDDKQDIIVLTTMIHLNQIGIINGIVSKTIIVQSNKDDAPALDADTSFFFEDRVYMGKVLDTFGPVKVPYYTVHLSSRIDASKLTKGAKVFFAPFNQKLTKYVFMEEIKKIKGSDASWRDDFEPPLHLLDYSDDEEERCAVTEENNQENCGRKSNANVKTDINFRPTQRQSNFLRGPNYNQTRNKEERCAVRVENNQQNCGKKPNGNIKREINFRPTQQHSNFFCGPNYNQTQNTLNGSNLYSSNVSPFVGQFSQRPHLFNNFTRMHQQIYLSPQNCLSSNIQPLSFPLPVVSQSSPRSATPLYIPPQRFTVVNNPHLRTDVSTSFSTRGNVPFQNKLPANIISPKSFINVSVTSQPSVIPASQVLIPLGITSHQNSFHPPAVNNLPLHRTVLPTMLDSSLPVSLGNSSNMFPVNTKHGQIVNLNGFTLMR